MLQRPAIDSCTTLPITGYYIHAIVTNTNGDVNEIVYTSNDIDDMLGGIMGEFSVSYNDSFEQDLYPNANYIFIVKIHNNVSKITRANARPSCSKYCLHTYVYMAMHTYVLATACITYTYSKTKGVTCTNLYIAAVCDLILCRFHNSIITKLKY